MKNHEIHDFLWFSCVLLFQKDLEIIGCVWCYINYVESCVLLTFELESFDRFKLMFEYLLFVVFKFYFLPYIRVVLKLLLFPRFVL